MLQSDNSWPDSFLVQTTDATKDATTHIVKAILELP